MKEPGNQATQKIIKTFAIITVLFAVISITAAPALANDDDDEVNFIIPEHGYTVDYYRRDCRPSSKNSEQGIYRRFQKAECRPGRRQLH
jgi:hypothetical protein